jgi:hypothetical protein
VVPRKEQLCSSSERLFSFKEDITPMSITFELPNFPYKDQFGEIDEKTGQPAENAKLDCAPTSIAAGLQYLLGQRFTGDQVKDIVYGKDWIGATQIKRYVAYCRDHGITLLDVENADKHQLLESLHTAVRTEHPTLVTIPGKWSNPPGDCSGITHVIIAYGEGPGVVRFMNPFGWWSTAPRDLTDAWLLEHGFCYNHIWPMTRTVMEGWEDREGILTAPNGIRVKAGFRLYVLNHQWEADNWPLEEEHPQDPMEVGNPAIGPGVQQAFRKCILCYSQGFNQDQDYEMWAGQEILALRRKVQETQG